MQISTENPILTSSSFEPSSMGAIRHWLVSGPKLTPYRGPSGPEHILRREALDHNILPPPPAGALGEAGPFGQTWQFHDPNRNEYIEFSTFYQELTIVEYYASTEVIATEPGEWAARFWSAGIADLWVNDEHLGRLNVTRYRNPDFRQLTIPLKDGANHLLVRLQCLGIRDTRILFGLFLDNPEGLTVRVPGATQLAQALQWIDGVHAPHKDTLASSVPAPLEAQVHPDRAAPLLWPKGAKELSLGDDRPTKLTVTVQVDEATLTRQLDIPGNSQRPGPPVGDRRVAHLACIAKAGLNGESPASWNSGLLPLLARRLLGRTEENDTQLFNDSLKFVDKRSDCADFILAALLRLEWLGLATAEESAQIRRTALAFRYWEDEPGSDAMCFWSENHSLLFHGCQLLAGRLYPQEIFSNSGRSGEEQIAIALPRIHKWLEHIEARGFEEFNSGTYMPITVAAMLNVVDFCGDETLSARMAAQVDRIFRDIAHHAFADAVISPQGRAYQRNVLSPETSGTQTLLAYATDVTNVRLDGARPSGERSGDWMVFPASSPKYRPPSDLAESVQASISKTYHQADMQIVLQKTPAYILTSFAVPAVPREGEKPGNDLRPGGAGYQQHLWQATLGWGCHVFVNHPGAFFYGSLSRPGYWYGNGLLPRIRQEENWLQAIYVIPDGTQTEPEITNEVWQWGSTSTVRPYDVHPVPFTHAHWPKDSFDREEKHGHWLFGQKGRGLIGLWCSEPLTPHDDVLTGREQRAYGYASAWFTICGDLDEAGSLENFIAACQAREPRFDKQDYTLHMRDASPTRWWERTEPMPR